jgi:predicted RNA-binding Zn ribbon-like protein
MSPSHEGSTLFDLAGGHPALDLVNSLDNRFRTDGPNENLVGFDELLRFLRETALLSLEQAQVLKKKTGSETAGRVLQAVRELREASAAVWYAAVEEKAPPARDLRTLERYFLETNSQRHLLWESGPSWQWRTPDGSDPQLALWILSQSVNDLMFSDQAALVRTCGVDTCRWLFIDTSKNHTRRWCNMKVCGNRMKARRFQARRGS